MPSSRTISLVRAYAFTVTLSIYSFQITNACWWFLNISESDPRFLSYTSHPITFQPHINGYVQIHCSDIKYILSLTNESNIGDFSLFQGRDPITYNPILYGTSLISHNYSSQKLLCHRHHKRHWKIMPVQNNGHVISLYQLLGYTRTITGLLANQYGELGRLLHQPPHSITSLVYSTHLTILSSL